MIVGTEKQELTLYVKTFYSKPFDKLIEKIPVYLLLEMGKRVASTDYVVRYYYNSKHKKFYKNKEGLKKCIRRAWNIGAFNHRRQLLNILESSEKIVK